MTTHLKQNTASSSKAGGSITLASVGLAILAFPPLLPLQLLLTPALSRFPSSVLPTSLISLHFLCRNLLLVLFLLLGSRLSFIVPIIALNSLDPGPFISGGRTLEACL